MNFFSKMFSGKSDVSSKRVIGAFILIGTAIVSWYTILTITENAKLSVIVACFTTGAALFGFTIWEKNQKSDNENPT